MLVLPGDLIFVRGTSPLSRGIELAEHGRYSHVAIYAGDGKVIEAQGGRTVGYNDLAAYAGKYDVGRVQCALFRRKQVLEYAKKQFGIRYDYTLIAFLFMKLTFQMDWSLKYKEHQAFICSTLVNDAWGESGVRLCPNDYPTPQELADSPLVQIEQTTN